MTDYIKTISEVLADLKTNKNSDPKLVRDWRKMIPEESKWFPGCPGDPFCKQCDGRGYLRLDGLPIGHMYFGRILLCDCTKGRVNQMSPMPKEYNAPEDPPFLDDPIEQETQAVFDTSEAFRNFADRKRVK